MRPRGVHPPTSRPVHAADPSASSSPTLGAGTSLASSLPHERCSRWPGAALNVDFHAVVHWGDDPVLEKHYVPRRSQRTRSVLTFFAEDAATHTLLYANADLSKASQNREVIAFADHWHQVTGRDPALLIFDSKLTTQAVLAELDDREIKFITLRARHPGITAQLAALPDSAWTSLTLGPRPRADPPRQGPRRPRRRAIGLPPGRCASSPSASTRSPAPSRSTSTSTSPPPSWPAPSAQRSAACPATAQPPPTPCSAGSCPLAASAPLNATRSHSATRSPDPDSPGGLGGRFA
jgi:hypothetical protein